MLFSFQTLKSSSLRQSKDLTCCELSTMAAAFKDWTDNDISIKLI